MIRTRHTCAIRWLLLFAALCANAPGCGDSQTETAAGIPACDQMQATWDELVDTEDACTTDRDCVVVGAPESCDCEIALGPDAVRRSAASRAEELQRAAVLGRCDKVEGGPARVCDVPPADAHAAVCRAGRCELRWGGGCLPLPTDQPDGVP